VARGVGFVAVMTGKGNLARRIGASLEILDDWWSVAWGAGGYLTEIRQGRNDGGRGIVKPVMRCRRPSPPRATRVQ